MMTEDLSFALCTLEPIQTQTFVKLKLNLKTGATFTN